MVPSRNDYAKKISVGERIHEDSKSGYLEWAISDKRPVLITNETKCTSMSIYEYKFWLDMTDMKTGYIRKQGKGIVDIFIIFTGGGPYRRKFLG